MFTHVGFGSVDYGKSGDSVLVSSIGVFDLAKLEMR
jgi:hypothetical protein